ncbi:MAG TPA: protein kinase [Gemmatimonadales bacterium]|nr:protein kinase [Gemmatimonadales bacterium]
MADQASDAIEERLRTSLADRYEVERKLGEGGMALVYLARDLKHDRRVAIKVLKPDLAASIGSERFLREIRNTAKLSHPHILPLYDSGDADGALYYVMPFVEGESLSDYMVREKQLSIEEAVRITREVAEALAHAHSYGLIHRDIKPDNILLSGGHAIVADFGISKALSEAGSESLTQTGTSVGTPAYMSPEQAMGSADVDGRSDIYSLGCVLYEMLVGQIPFTGPTPVAIMARHAMDQITPPHIMRDTIPEELEGIIYVAMAKTPADRFRTAHEFVEALKAFETGLTAPQRVSMAVQRASVARMSRMGTPPTPVPSLPSLTRPAWRRAVVPAGIGAAVIAIGVIGWKLVAGGGNREDVVTLDPRRVAVLYFEDLSRDSSLAHIGDGLAEALMDRLSTVSQLEVLSRDAVARYRDPRIPRDSIGNVLQAGSLIAGSVEPVGERVRVTVRLVDGFSGSGIETRTFELPSANLLTVRDSAAELVSGFLRARLGEEVMLRERRRGTAVVEAWTLVQRAERSRKAAAEVQSRDRDAARRAYQEADSLLALAERADSRWPEPTVLRGWVAYDLSVLTREAGPAAELVRAALRYADRALQVEPRDTDALHLRGRARHRLWSLAVTPDPAARARLLDSAQVDLETAVRIDPRAASAWYALSLLHHERKDLVAAALAAERSYEADAFLQFQDRNLYQLFETHYNLEQFPNAQRWCEEGARRFPRRRQFVGCQLMMLISPWAQADVGKAWALARRMDSLTTGAPDSALLARDVRIFVGGVLARAGQADSARAMLLANRAGRDIDHEQRLAVREAIMRVLLGDLDEAVELWRRYALANPDHKIDPTVFTHWWWRPLRDHRGFQSLTRAQ